ncbi:4Fe-4S dicluster domain-containing ferredoxin protein [Brevinematales bacterium NS]|nr:4Fe-4S dicluster domain-containing protein [Brevinematales bacterium]QJR23021.1 4Fe-4S dicluster domain-containing ferredoxin protein [Brevinematales bacterium NS]
MKRQMIVIDQEKCNGCGLCIPNCPEGALQLIDGKARLVSEFYCDGLGACVGVCPENALHVEEREALPYDETRVIENIIPQGRNVIDAHLKHLVSHNQWKDYEIALRILSEKKIPFTHFDFPPKTSLSLSKEYEAYTLTNWPIQLHLVNSSNELWNNAHILLASDCTAFSLPGFHSHLKNKKLLIACPKLDSHQEIYLEKLSTIFEKSAPASFTIMVMEVPCCRGLAFLAKKAREMSGNNLPLKVITVGIEGTIVGETEI